ncbi:MAG: TonB-dependent receptor plug domain-containing protein, partial [Burkholderiaceae bacterium]
MAQALLGALVGAALCLPTPSVQAQAAPVAVETPRSFDVPAGTLDQALSRLGRQAGAQIAVNAELTAGLTSPGVSGSYTVTDALQRLLAGTGLEAVRDAGGEYTLRKAAPGAAREAGPPQAQNREAVLPPVVVQGRADLATEGTGSYTTRSSSAATGLNLSLRETPQSVSVMTRERLDDQNLTTLTGTLEQVTGLALDGSGGGGGATTMQTVHSRGFQLDNVVYDGLPIPIGLFGNNAWDGWASVSMDPVDSVTVVRGSTGLMTGNGQPGGTIALTRKRPTESLQGSVAMTLGRWNERRIVADVGGPLNQAGTLRGRMVASYDEGNSWLQRFANHGDTVYGVLEADLGKKTQLALAYQQGRRTSTGIAAGAGFATTDTDGRPTPFGRSDNANAAWSRRESRYQNLLASLDHRFNADWSAKVRYLIGSGDIDRKYAMANRQPSADGSYEVYARSNKDGPDTRAFSFSLDGRYRLWGQESQLTVGMNGYSFDFRASHDLEDYSTMPGPITAWDGRFPEPDWSTIKDADTYDAKVRQYGLFINNRLKINEPLSLITGLRLSNWRSHAISRQTRQVNNREESNI